MSKIDGYDVLIVLGIGGMAAALYFIYEPLALLVPSVVVLLIGLVGAWNAGRGE